MSQRNIYVCSDQFILWHSQVLISVVVKMSTLLTSYRNTPSISTCVLLKLVRHVLDSLSRLVLDSLSRLVYIKSFALRLHSERGIYMYIMLVYVKPCEVVHQAELLLTGIWRLLFMKTSIAYNEIFAKQFLLVLLPLTPSFDLVTQCLFCDGHGCFYFPKLSCLCTIYKNIAIC